MPELPLVADKIHAHSHRKDHRKLKEIKMGKVPVGVGEVTMLILRSKKGYYIIRWAVRDSPKNKKFRL